MSYTYTINISLINITTHNLYVNEDITNQNIDTTRNKQQEKNYINTVSL